MTTSNAQPNSPRPHLLVAEDDADLRHLIANALRNAGYTVIECVHGMDLVQRLEGVLKSGLSSGVLGVITDIRMPGVTGLSILEGLHGLHAGIPVFVITAFGSAKTHARARELGAVRTFDKPFDIVTLVDEVVRVVGGA